MVAWELFRRKAAAQKMVKSGRFEIERNVKIAYLEFSLSASVLELIHTEIPENLRGMGCFRFSRNSS